MDIMAIGAHPDDVDFGCGGILCREAARGRKIVIVDLTVGEMGTNGTPKLRRQEGLDAAATIGAERIVLGLPDCGVRDTDENRLRLVEVIRHYRPRLVLAQQPHGVGQHPDHFAAGTLARIACRFARFAKVLPEHPVHWVEGILHYGGATPEEATFLVDVTEHMETWRAMMACHASQMKTFNYVERVLDISQHYGILIGTQYAQGLTQRNSVVIDDILSVSKGTREL